MANAREIPLYNPGATALGGTPTTPVPMAPPGSTAPEAPSAGEDAGVSALSANGGGATLADRLKASGSPFLPNFVAASNAAAKSDPEAAAAPSGWARTVLAGAMHGLAPAASNVVSGLGNAAAVGEIPRGSGKLGGAFVGISRALNAGNQQAAQQKQQKFENQQKTEEMGMKEESHRALMAEGQLRMIQLNQAIQKQDEDIRKESLAGTSSYVKSYVDRGYHEEVMNYDELQKASKDPDFWKYHTGGKIGEVPMIGADNQPVVGKDGKTIYNPQYGIIDLRTKPAGSGPHVVSPEESKRWANGGVDVPPGTTLQDDQLKVVSAKAEQGVVNRAVVDKANGEVMDAEKREQLRPDFDNPTVSSAVTQYPGRPIKGVAQRLQATDAQVKSLTQQIADAQAKNPNDPAIAQLQQKLDATQAADNSLHRVMQYGFNEAAQKDELAAQREDEKEAHDRAEEAIQDKRADVAAKKGLEDKQLQTSYGVQNKEFDLIRKPLATQLDSFSTLRNSLDQGTATGDSVVAPALLKALVAGGGVRITQAEIAQFTHGRSTLEDMRGYLQKMQSGKSITPVQRQQVYALLGAVEAKADQKKAILEDTQTVLDQATTVEGQRAAVRAARTRLDALDKSEQQRSEQRRALPPAPAGKVAVQIPGSQPGFIPQGNLAQFQKDHPNAIIGQQ